MAKKPEMHEKLQELAARQDNLGTTIPWDRLTVNRWEPDTCDCIVNFYFDDDDPQTVEFADVVKACPAHDVDSPTADLVQGRKVHTAVSDENRRKNRVMTVVANELGIDLTTESGQVTFRGRFTVDWQATTLIDGLSRVVTVTVTGISNQQRDTLQAYADAEFGTGAIVVVRG